MAFHHRKLLNDSLIEAALCNKLSCNISTNPTGKCTSTCWDICADGFCKELIEIPLPPPPLPPPPPPPVHAPSDAGNKSGPSLSFALTASLAVLATAFFLFTCYTIYKFYTVWSSSRRRSPPPQPEEDDDDYDFFDEENHGPVVDHPIWYIRTIGLQPSVINAIAIVSYKRADGLVDGTDCAVCLSEFEEDETLRLLPKCSHAFHIPCIDTWLRSHTNCPLCRAGIVSSAAAPPPPAQDLGRVEEARLEIAASEREVEEESRSQRGVEIDEQIEGDDGKVGIQGVRRSVSMDSLSASMITAAVANAFPQQFGKNSDNELVKEKEIVRRVGLNQSSSMNQTGSSSIKRSASCSAKVFLSRHSSSSRSRS